ncbi:hypothetical protein GCM10023084_45270 [Streptomyces lacrimifluminis]|uniref:Uncharacterized protein n=1 Tax=Streptomyces lacrimifluminis TaxID=1500077 RepID=A0A917L703_9ACTN|nr:hypothetical protein [Streptomyces lacrimifluminis]GGJ45143.1 hypothetical protein GCM10012282_47570 [Streptomyces lacrimifluminis]
MNDDELLAHLKATDPALTSKAPRPDVTRLVEATMNTQTATTTTPPPAKATQDARPRRRLVPALAFAALLLVGGGVSWGVAQGGEDTADKAGAGAAGVGSVPQLQPLTLMLPDGDPAAAKCAAPTPDLLRGHELAFEGTVTAENGGRVVLKVDHWYRKDANLANPSHEVRLSNDYASSEAPDFEIGAHYLVTADGGIVPMCGGTTEATDEGRAMFEEAFGAPKK